VNEFIDYYSLLDVPFGATIEEIRQAYRAEISLVHPDRHQGAPGSVLRRAKQRSVRLNRAYETFTDPERRRVVRQQPADATGEEGFDVMAFFSSRDIEVIDKRPERGALWVVGGPDLAPVLKDLSAQGFEFAFATGGGRATGHRPAWYTK
jgi:curved DNA-binding protein CbpA